MNLEKKNRFTSSHVFTLTTKKNQQVSNSLVLFFALGPLIGQFLEPHTSLNLYHTPS